MSGTTPFIHLRTHSHYSLLQGLSKLDELVATARAYDMPALALTDYANMYGAIEFWNACKKKEIKPIIGAEVYLAPRTIHDKDAGIDDTVSNLVLLAENETGYKNLMKIVSASHTDGLFVKPRVDLQILKTYHEGIIALSGGHQGFIDHLLIVNDMARAQDFVAQLQAIFGTDNFFLEIMQHEEFEHNELLFTKVQELSQITGAPLVATWNAHYLKEENREAFRTLLQIDNHGDRAFRERFRDNRSNYAFISTSDAYTIFKDVPEAVARTAAIAERCTLDLQLGVWTFPNFPIPAGTTYDAEMRREVYEGIQRRGLEQTDELVQRIEYELEIIKNKGFSIYMLMVADLIRFARENKIFTTIRGSVAGSMATYLLGITTVNPFEYKLPFERFLNPERPSAPDIDMDFADNRRDEVLDYARAKYGAEKVAQIGTFGTMMARGAVRDVARAMGFPYGVADTISKMIPMGSQGMPMTIDKALASTPELKEAYENDRNTKEILDMAKTIEGGARHVSVHAAGVVIAPTELTDFTPIQRDPKGGKLISQYDMRSVGEDGAGLIKLDFLGIRNLAILGDAVARVEKIRGITVDIETIPLDDKKAFEMLARGETIGLFQLNGAGMTRYLKELRPTTIHDINAMVALYRPGPMESIPEYIKRKYNASAIKYLDPRMATILDQSYGVITYQDDVMLIAIHLAGYSWLEADKLRKAMGKKIPEVMAAEKDKLMDGLLKNGMSQKKADELWALIEPFAAYGFNKAHAASYGRVAYQTAYMKANYAPEFMTAVLTAESGDLDTVAEVIHEAKRMGFQVLPPDINESFSDFTAVVENGEVTQNIRFGLRSIKNLGENIGKAIIAERKQGGPYTSLAQFLERVRHKDLNKKSLESLIKCGALDAFGERKQLLHNLEDLLAHAKELGKQHEAQVSLFGGITSSHTELKLAPCPPATNKETSYWEKDLLGVYVSSHPLDPFRERLENSKMNLKTILESGRKGSTVVFGALIENIKLIMTKKNNERMAFVKFADLTTTMEGVVFPKTFVQYKDMLVEDAVVVVEAKISDRDGEKSLMVDKIRILQ